MHFNLNRTGQKTIALMNSLRQNNISCFMMDKISKALEFSNSQNIPNVIFIGEDEVKKKKFKLRDMKTGKEQMLSEKELLESFEKKAI